MQKFTTENFSHLIIEKKYSEKEILDHVKFESLNLEEQKDLKQKIEFAYKRIETPLEIEDKIFYFFFPFGVIAQFISNEYDKNLVKEYYKRGFLRKIKERKMFSIIGVLSYLVIPLFIYAFFLS